MAERVARHWIDGEWVEAGEPGESRDPATGEVIGRYHEAGAEIADRAVAAASAAFARDGWAGDRALRARVLNAMADRFAARIDDIAELLGLENGKVVEQGRFEVGIVPETLRFNAALALTELGRGGETAPGQLSLLLRQPVGVAGVIAPWNSPAALAIRSLAPALAAGCTAVVMLPRQTAQVNTLLAEVIAGTPELPRGVVNLITGGKEAGNALVVSSDVPTISFTGSTQTGRDISANAAPGLKRLGLELGGKTPIVVFDDADLEAAVPQIVQALTVFSGQFCMTGSRLLVQHGVAEALRAKLAAALEAVRVGPASDPTSEMGPLIDRPNVERVDKMVEDAVASGASVVVRGGPVRDGPLARGAFYRPTLIEVDDSGLDIVQKEVFGPVLTLQRFADEDEAVALANATPYGLAASVWSNDFTRPLRIARKIDAGTVWVNAWALLADAFEEGGFKASGQGRMRGLAVLEDFLEYKHIAFNVEPKEFS